MENKWADTLNLEDYARLGLRYLGEILDKERKSPYFSINLLSDPPEMSLLRGPLCLDFHSALLLRTMVGGYEGTEIEDIYKRLFIDSTLNGTGGYGIHTAATWYQQKGDETIKEIVEKSITRIWKTATVSEKKEYAYMPTISTGSAIAGENKRGYLEDWANRVGYYIMPLVKWYELTGNRSALKLAKYFANWIIFHTDMIKNDGGFTLSKSEDEYISQGYDMKGHVESRLWIAAGIIRYGVVTKNNKLVEWGKKVVDYVDKISKGTGSNSFGWFYENVMYQPLSGCETCCITRIIDCAILLTKAGYPEYWNLVERAARNHLIESQLLDISWIKTTKKKDDTDDSTFNNVAERSKGGWAGWSDPNDWVGERVSKPGRQSNFSQVMNCCVAGGEGLYHVWHNIVTKNEEGVWVNLSLNRATKWLDIKSYRPYEGKIEILIKKVFNLFVRVPDWVNKGEVRVTLNEKPIKISWRGNYVELNELEKGQIVTITYPLRKLKENITLIPENAPTLDKNRYVIIWKGDTVTEIFPKGKIYPLYQREHYKTNKAPLKKIAYRIPEKEIDL